MVILVRTKINFASSILTECQYSSGPFLHEKSDSRKKRESVSSQHSMEIDEQWEC